MSRITRTSAAFIALALVGITSAQTAARNPQRPQVKVEDGRTKKEVSRDASKIDALLTRGLKRHQEVPLPSKNIPSAIPDSHRPKGLATA